VYGGHLRADLRELAATGWISLDEAYDLGSSDCELTPAGAGRLEHVRLAARTPSAAAARPATPCCAGYERKVSGVHPPVISDFPTSPAGGFYGHPYPERDVNDASRHLKDRGLLTGTRSFGGGIIRPSITTAGEALVESGRSINDPGPVTGPAVRRTPGSQKPGGVARAGREVCPWVQCQTVTAAALLDLPRHARWRCVCDGERPFGFVAAAGWS
jgi:hypothetical protein